MNISLEERIDIRQEVPIRSFSIAAFVCSREKKNGYYLILKRCSKYLKDSWQMVSGRLEKHETAWQAAIREIKEETGITPDALYSLNKIESFYEIEQNCINLVPIFIAFVDRKKSIIKLSDFEHDEYKWVTAADAPKYLIWDNHVDLIQYIEKEFIQKEPNSFLKIKW
jgi:dATP pyrophosphohydrolase